MAPPALQIQTVYAELLERAAISAFDDAFPAEGGFIRKTVKGNHYWYFQETTSEGRVQKYVGPETPETLERIRQHKKTRNDVQERRSLVSTLIRSFGSPQPSPEIGKVVQALAQAGAFRLRAVLIGTVAFQTYAPMLGVTLRSAALRTEDVDVAQFRSLSIAIEDHIPPMLQVLKEVDKTFRAVPHQVDGRRSVRYQADNELRVDFLTPNEGADTEEPQNLPALKTDAEPLRFLDFLIYKPEPAVLLYDAGIHILVPAPQRFALHKLIVSQRRSAGNPKRDKDLKQAEALLSVLVEKRPFELTEAWQEVSSRGKTWRQLLLQAMALSSIVPRDLTLRTVGENRAILPRLDLRFGDSPVRYDLDRDIAFFEAEETFGARVVCSISREALDDHFGTDNADQKGRIEAVRRNRSAIENIARAKYMSYQIEEPGSVLVKTEDVRKLSSRK